MLRSVQLWLLTATLAVSGSCLAAQIQPVGYACTPEGCSACNEGCQNGCNDGCNGYGDCYGNCYDCNGRCTPRRTWRDNCMNWTGHCGPIGRAARWGVPGARCLKYCCDTKAAPDSGWAPPARYPVNRMNTGFAAYSSYGGGGYGAAPMVYQPTDTTQLGYSYAHVPTWRRNPAMIPPTPEPSAFHARACPGGGYCGSCMGGCMMGGYGYGNCMSGQCMQGQIINQPVSGGYCPACTSQTSPAQLAPAQMVPATASVLPPATSTEGVVRMNRGNKPVQPAVQMKAVPVTRRVVAPRKVIVQASQQVVQQMPAPQKSVGPQKQEQTPKQVQKQRPVQRPVVRQQPVRKSVAKPKKSGGWFGLPSLSDVQF